jgi:hypothetical protein
VAAQVNAGQPADLRQKFPDEKDRKIGAGFLAALLTGILPGVTTQTIGIRISGAVIDGPLELPNAQIPCEVWFDYCQFNGKVDFSSASFAGNASFAYTTFKADALFDGTKVGDTAIFHKALFQGSAWFKNAVISGDFLAPEVQFKDTKIGAIFQSVTVGHLVKLDKAAFEGPANFEQANIGGDLEVPGAVFHDKQQGADFATVKVGEVAIFDGAIFAGPANFSADIAVTLSGSATQFQDKETCAYFASIKIGQNAVFNNALFNGPANFAAADIAGEFLARNATFQETGTGTSFGGMKIGGQAIFENAVFAGPVDFSAADVTGNFDMYGAQFTSKTGAIQLDMNCDRKGIFSPTTFAGPVSFADATFLDLVISGTQGAAPIPALDLSRASIKGYMMVWDLDVHSLTAESLKVEGPAVFATMNVHDSADLSDSTFSTLDLSLSNWPKNADAFHWQDVGYQCIRRYPTPQADESASHAELLKLADKSAFAADTYGNLEAFFLREGYKDDADNAFIAGKNRERRQAFDRGEYGRWFGSLALDCLVGYGRRPWYAEVYSAIIVAMGCFLFSPRKMELDNKDDTPRGYNPFWYSLGLFLPGVDLQAEKVWKPKQECVFLRNYKHVQILLGWILVPIVLIALTGLIK